MPSPTRPGRLSALVLFGLLPALSGALAIPVIAVVDPAEARAEEAEGDLGVGTELVATEDIRLHRAAIGKGSRVTVTKVTRDRGELSSVDVALADGHVVPGVSIAKIRTSFRVTDQG